MKRLWIVLLSIILLGSFTQKERSWVAIGDSITYLNDHPDETGNRITKGYLTRVTEQVPDLAVSNQGHNGWTAIRIATDFDKLGVIKADIYSIFLGTNDWWGSKPLGSFDDYQHHTGTGTVNGAFRVIIDKIRNLNPAAKIILITPMKRVDFVYINNYKNNAYGSYKEKSGQQLEQFADALLTIGAYEKLEVVDLFHERKMDYPVLINYKRLRDPATGTYKNFSYPDYANIPFDPAMDEYPYPLDAVNITYDGLHPSDKGYEIIAEKMIRILKH